MGNGDPACIENAGQAIGDRSVAMNVEARSKQQGSGGRKRKKKTDFFCLFLFRLCIPDWPQTHDLPASAFHVLGLQVCVTMPGLDMNGREEKHSGIMQNSLQRIGADMQRTFTA
jgi:hypothetical protein